MDTEEDLAVAYISVMRMTKTGERVQKKVGSEKTTTSYKHLHFFTIFASATPWILCLLILAMTFR